MGAMAWRESLHPRQQVVAAGDDDVGDLDGFGEGVLGDFPVPACREYLRVGEVLSGGNGVAGDEDCFSGLREKETASAGSNACDWEDVDAWSD